MNPHSILVVRLGAMGDIVHTLPAVARLKLAFAHSHLCWVVEDRWAPLLAGNPYVDEVLCFNRNRVRSAAELAQTLRRRRFDFAVDFQGLIKSSLVALVSGAGRIYGWSASVAREWISSMFYSTKLTPKSVHIVDQNLELAAAAGAHSTDVLFPVPAGRQEGVLPDGDFVLANPSAGWVSKQWPLEYYSEVGKRLLHRGLQLVLNGAHQQDVPGTAAHSSGIAGLIDATRKAVAVIGVDSGPLHLAAALRKPGVAIFGPTDPARNGPYGETIRVLRASGAKTSYKRGSSIDPSMLAVTPDDVWTVLQSVLPL